MSMTTSARTEKPSWRPAALAVLVSLLLATLKGVIWALTGSLAMLASMVDSAADAAVSGASLLALRAARRPADREHPFGHGSIEDLAALLQSLLIAASGIFVVTAALTRFGQGSPALKHIPLGIAAALVSLLAAHFLATFLRRAGEVHDSPALRADSEHYASDYLANLGVLVTFVAGGFFVQPLLDPAISIGIAFLILRTAWSMFFQAAHSLMDRELDQDSLAAIDEELRLFAPRVRGYHDLLTRRSGSDRFIQFHLEIDAELSFRCAHEVVESVTSAIEGRIPHSHVTVHADPWPEDAQAPEPRLPHAPDGSFPASSSLD